VHTQLLIGNKERTIFLLLLRGIERFLRITSLPRPEKTLVGFVEQKKGAGGDLTFVNLLLPCAGSTTKRREREYYNSRQFSEPSLPDKWRRPLISSRAGARTQRSIAPAYCFGVPPIGSDIEVLLSPYDRYAPTVYGPARVVAQSDTSCAFEVDSQVLGIRRFEGSDGRILFLAVIFVGLLAAIGEIGSRD
jgi:hypothetical protein